MSPSGETTADRPAGRSAPLPGTPRLDWCCIGAQKAGTSTLYRLLRQHPDLVIPPSKEDPLFDRGVSAAEFEEYLASRFGAAAGRLAGTVTPQYMSAPDTAARLATYAPSARIVVLLRDPVARALSHFRMSTLRGLEQRGFAAAVTAQLDELEAGRLPDLYSETDSYVVRGNYGWLLRAWFERFDREQILVLFNDDLDADPVGTVRRVHRFLGVPERDPETGVDFRFNASPPPHRASRWRRPVGAALRRVGWNRVHPERREQISSAVERTLARLLPAPPEELPEPLRRRMRAYYAPDGRSLRDLLGTELPWPEGTG